MKRIATYIVTFVFVFTTTVVHAYGQPLYGEDLLTSRESLITKELDCVDETLRTSKSVQWDDICYTNRGIDFNERAQVIKHALDKETSFNDDQKILQEEPKGSLKPLTSALPPKKAIPSEQNIPTGKESYDFFDVKNPLTKFEFGSEQYYYRYREPNFMKLKGWTYGLFGSYTYRTQVNEEADSSNNYYVRGNPFNMFKAETRFSLGTLDYSSEGTGTNDGKKHYTFEARGLAGSDIPMWKESVFTPYSGLGYRYLLGNSGGDTTTTGAGTYDRESYYLYIPLGIDAVFSVREDWSLGFNFEYDYFVGGVQRSHLEDVRPTLNTLKNDQDSGYGLRSSIKLKKEKQKFDIYCEPFFRFWKIDESEVSLLTYSGVALGYGLEPVNNTYEYGLKLGAHF